MNPVDINGTEIKVGDKIKWKFKEGSPNYKLLPDWNPQVYDIATNHPHGYCDGMCGLTYNYLGECDGYIRLDSYGVDYLIVERDGATHNEPSGELDPPIFVDDNGKVVKDNQKVVSDGGPLNVQCGGDHYKNKAIQPIEYILANNLNFCEGNAIKYLTRWRDKGGIEDLNKAKHYIDILIERERLVDKT